MLGAIVGDIIGSAYEHDAPKYTDFELFTRWSRFTDDSVLTVATAHAILTGARYADAYHEFGNRYPGAGYGGAFRQWLALEDRQPYNSWGNGAAMRVSPIAWAYDSAESVLAEAERSASATHDHPDGIRGAHAAALAVFLARSGAPKDEIRREIAGRFQYDLGRTVEEIRPGYSFDVSCQRSVPEAIIAFLDSDDVEHAIRLAVSLGGDADTQAAIAGGIAEAFHGAVPDTLAAEATARLPSELLEITERFRARFS
jgi:ADP-ribosylglycohydrolase